MALGYVLISAKSGTERDVYTKLMKCDKILEMHPLFGEYDLIVKVEDEDANKIGKIVVDRIRTIEDVVDTKTLLTLGPGIIKQTKKEPVL